MYIESLSLKNLRCFREVEEMRFQYPGRARQKNAPPGPTLGNVNLLLGNNGTGKTTKPQF
jgi:DNA repair exonuclease SbcCD ATPase subunit